MMSILTELTSSGLFEEHELLVLEEAIYRSMYSGTRSRVVVEAIRKLRAQQGDTE